MKEEQSIAIRTHNRKLMKFILCILLIDIIIISIGWHYDNTNLANLGAGIGLTCGLIGLWIIIHRR